MGAATHAPALIDDHTRKPPHARFSRAGLSSVTAVGLGLWIGVIAGEEHQQTDRDHAVPGACCTPLREIGLLDRDRQRLGQRAAREVGHLVRTGIERSDGMPASRRLEREVAEAAAQFEYATGKMGTRPGLERIGAVVGSGDLSVELAREELDAFVVP
jgi:hypothetical protein